MKKSLSEDFCNSRKLRKTVSIYKINKLVCNREMFLKTRGSEKNNLLKN